MFKNPIDTRQRNAPARSERVFRKTTLVIGCTLLVASIGLIPTQQAFAQELGASFSLPQTPYMGGLANGVDGFEFIPTQNISITELGWYDDQGDGLLHSHPVAIFDTALEASLASATVTTASPFDAASGFRFETLVTPLALVAGHSYTVGGLGTGPDYDPYAFQPVGGVTYGPEISFVQYRGEFTDTLVFPNDLTGQDPFFGPNFRYDSAVVLGDVNLDGVVDLLDVAPFVALLISGDFQVEADINMDGVVDLLDVQPFVDLLTG